MNLLQWRKTLIKKKYYSWSDIEKMCHQITVQLYNSAWKPDLIITIDSPEFNLRLATMIKKQWKNVKIEKIKMRHFQ